MWFLFLRGIFRPAQWVAGCSSLLGCGGCLKGQRKGEEASRAELCEQRVFQKVTKVLEMEAN